MAGTFEAFGNEVRSTMAGFASSVSGEIISSISPIIYTGIMIYFFARAYQITTGRAEGAIPDLITQCVKIVSRFQYQNDKAEALSPRQI